MALTVVFVSGPRRSGKSTVIQRAIAACGPSTPHYIRLTPRIGDKQPPSQPERPTHDCGVASAHWISYDEDRVYEFLPATLNRIHRQDRRGTVIIEADSDPLLRHAYPYDSRVFVMPAPLRSSEVFRTASQAADAFNAALNDTAAFAGEIYGLVEDKGDAFDVGAHESRSVLTASQVRGLMSSPLGDELATRILLQPTHHGLLESDVVIVNTAIGGVSPLVDQTVHRLERVLERVRASDVHKPLLVACDPVDTDDPLCTKLFHRLANLIGCGGKS